MTHKYKCWYQIKTLAKVKCEYIGADDKLKTTWKYQPCKICGHEESNDINYLIGKYDKGDCSINKIIRVGAYR